MRFAATFRRLEEYGARMSNETKVLMELRAARAEYDKLCWGRTAELNQGDPPPLTDVQIAAMKRLMLAEQSWKHRAVGSS
jgi:hypothetical protein